MIEINDADLAGWRDQPVTKAWLEWFHDQIGFYREQIPRYVVKGENDRARVAAGALEAYQEILLAIRPPQDRKPEVEEKFVDPATRLSLRSKDGPK